MTYGFKNVETLRSFGLSQEQASDIHSAGFSYRSENLMLLGNPATYAKYIAQNIISSAAQEGRSTAVLSDMLSAWPHDELLEERAHAFTGWERNARNFRAELLESDILVVEHAHTWMQEVPILMCVLLCMRAEKGKSTVMTATAESWMHMLDEGRFAQQLADNNFIEVSVLSDTDAAGATNEWVRFVKRSYGALIARRELLASLGLDVVTSTPYLPRRSSFGDSFGWNIVRTEPHGRHHFVRG